MAAASEERSGQELRLRGGQQPEETPQDEAGAQDADKEEKKETPPSSSPPSRFNAHAILWIVSSALLTYFTDFFPVMHSVILEGSVWLKFGGLALCVSLCITVYCIIYLEWLCGVADYDTRYPGLIPIAIISFLVATVCINISLWHAWSLFTPVLLFTQFMGCVMLVSLFG